MNLKRVTITLVSASVVALAGLVVLPDAAYAASHKSLWVNSAALTSAHGKSCTSPGYNSIQAAITAAPSGATIHVCPGSGPYVEQLTITQPVSIVGAGSGVTVELPADPAVATTACDTAPGTEAYQADQDEVSVCTPGTVRITNLTVQAFWAGGTCNDSLYGILVAGGADLKMTDSTLHGGGANPINGCQGGIGIQVGMAWTDPVEVGHATLKGVIVDGYQKNGITVDGTGSTGTIVGTTVTGAGATVATAQNGIQISNGAKGTITDSTVSGDECDLTVEVGIGCGSDPNADYQAAGILLYGAAAGSSVTHSTISGSDMGVYVFDNDATAPTSSVANIADDAFNGDRYEAVVLDQGWATVTSDTLTDGNIGILVFQYDGQTYGVKAIAKNDTVSGMSVAAADIDSDGVVGDFPGSLSITKSAISGNPGSIIGSVLDNSTNYAVTLKKDT